MLQMHDGSLSISVGQMVMCALSTETAVARWPGRLANNFDCGLAPGPAENMRSGAEIITVHWGQDSSNCMRRNPGNHIVSIAACRVRCAGQHYSEILREWKLG